MNAYVEIRNTDGQGNSGFVATGYLTTEHAASSYGMPVFVATYASAHAFAAQPGVYGPADLPSDVVMCVALDERSAWRSNSERDEIAAAARKAGYAVNE